MLPIKKVISPANFNAPSLEGLRAAIEIAELFDAEIILAHVIKSPAWMALSFARPQGIEPTIVKKILQEEAIRKLFEIQSAIIPGHIRSRVITEEGAPADSLVRIAKEQSADLIVIATNGHSEFHRFVFGSVTDRVMRTAACPVLTISATKSDS